MIDVNDSDDGTKHRSGNDTHSVRYDPTDDLTASEIIVFAVADIDDADPLEMHPLYDAIDPGMLDAFVSRGHDVKFDSIVTFAFEGHAVTVHASGLVEIE